MPTTEEKLKQAIRTYNKIAEIYAKYTEEKLIQFQLARFESMLPGKKILDAGCGAGRDVEYFSEDGFDVIGIDISEGLLKVAKKKFPKGNFKKMDFRKTTFKDNTFDGIWSMAGLVHLPKTEIKKALKEFYRILKPYGIIYISVKRGKGSREIKKDILQGEPRIYYFFEKDEMEELIRNAGFKIVSSEANNVWLEFFAEKGED